MTETTKQHRCSGAPECGDSDCRVFKSHSCIKPGRLHHCPEAVVGAQTVRCEPVEPGPEMKICPRHNRCKRWSGRCYHLKSHRHDSSCARGPMCPACVPVDEAPPFHGVYPRIVKPLADVEQASYPACPECGRSDRPVCCVPVEQLAPEPPAPVGLDVDRIVANYSNPTMRIVKADITALAAEIEQLRKANSYQGGYIAGLEHLRDETVPSLERDNTVLRTMLREAQDPSIAAQEEIERLREMLVKRFGELRASQERLRRQRCEMHDEIERLEQERDELKTRREYALSALGEMTIAFAELQAELAALNSAAIAGWLAEIASK